MQLIEENLVNIVSCNARTFKSINEYKKNKFKYRNYFLYNKILNNKFFSIFKSGINLIPNSGTLIKRNKIINKLISNYPISKHEDFIFYKILLERDLKVLITDKYLINYFINSDSFTGNKIQSRIWHYKLLINHFNFSPLKALLSVISGSILLLIIRLIETKKNIKPRKESFIII